MSLDNYEEREAYAVAAIKKNLKLNSRILKQKSIFANVYDNSLTPDLYTFSTADTAGSKVIIATLMQKYDTIGIDCVAMNANDAATLGRIMPDQFMNCISCQEKIDEEGITGEIIKGIQKAVDECDVSDIIKEAPQFVIGKGEKASMPDVISGPVPGYGFDVAGSMTGFIKKSGMPDFNPKHGDVIIGIQSSGVHCNGFTTIRLKLLDGSFESRPEFRKFYTGSHKLNEPFGNITLGEELLKPTSLYVKVMADAATKFPGSFGVNITGYGLKNFNRFGRNLKYVIDNPMPIQPIFDLIKESARLNDEQMYEKFNMGMGFAVITEKNNADSMLSIIEKHGFECKKIGAVERFDKETSTVLKNKKLEFVGY